MSSPHSMTGFGRGSSEGSFGSIAVEIRSYNHRFQEFSMKLPRSFQTLEGSIKTFLGERLHRGRIDISVTRSSAKTERGAVTVNEPLFRAYLGAYEKAFEIANVGLLNRGGLRRGAVFSILNRPDVIGMGDADSLSEDEKEGLFAALSAACTSLMEMRAEEGARLLADLESRVKEVRAFLGRIREEAQGYSVAAKERISGRVKKFAPEVVLDEARLAAEVALLADKADITEETVRLESHLSGFSDALKMRPAGRRLDFLLQEMGRECTTISSKAQSASVQKIVVDIKVEIERMREQIQNIE